MKKDSTRTGATLCSSMRPRSATTSWLNKFKLLAFAFMALLSVNVWGETATFGTDWNSQFGTSYPGSFNPKTNELTLSASVNNVSFTANNNSSTSGYVKTGDFRMYNGYTLTITAPANNNITSIVGTSGTSGKYIAGISANVGSLSYTDANGDPCESDADDVNVVTWTGSANSVVFTASATNGFETIVVTYSPSITYTDYLTDCGPSIYTVTFDANEGSVTPTSATQESEGATISLPTPTRDCYECTGWYTEASGGTKRGDAGGSYVPTATEKLYAQWTPKRYDAIYDANGVTGYTGELPATVTYDCGDQVTVSQSPRLSKFGYTFIGWNTNPAATTPQPAESNPFTIDQGDTYIYAIWNAIKPTSIAIAPESGGYQPKKGTTTQMIATLTPDASTMAEENREITWSSSDATRAFINQQGQVSFVGTGQVTITATSKVDGSVQGNYTFYVQAENCDGLKIRAYNGYKQDDYFHKVGTTNEWRCPYVLKNGGDHFWVGECDNQNEGWQEGKSQEMSFNDIPLRDYRTVKTNPSQDLIGTLVIWDNSSDKNYGICFEPTYMISYMTDASNWRIMEFHPTSTANSYETELLQVPEGYKNNSNMKYYVGLKKANGDNVSIYNKSRQDAMNGVSGLSSADIAGKYGKWHISTNSGDMNWYCTFNRYYQVQFEMNGGDGNIDPMYFYANNTESFNTNTLTNPTKTGYNLTGWKDQEDNTYTTSESITVTKDLVLTAQWEEKGYVNYRTSCTTVTTVTLNKGDHGQANGSATIKLGTSEWKTFTAVAPMDHFDLDGYYYGDTKVIDANGTLVSNVSGWTTADGKWDKDEETATLTAKFTQRTFTVTTSDIDEVINHVVNEGETYTLPALSCATGDFTRVGWTTTAPTDNAWATRPTITEVGAAVSAAGTYYAVYGVGSGDPNTFVRVNSITDGAYVITSTEEDPTIYAMKYTGSGNLGAQVITESSTGVVNASDPMLIWNVTVSGSAISLQTQNTGTNYIGVDSNKENFTRTNNLSRPWTVDWYNGKVSLNAGDDGDADVYLNYYDTKFGLDYDNRNELVFYKQEGSGLDYISNPVCCENKVAAPVVNDATKTHNSITLSWSNVTGATGYKVTINGATHDVTTSSPSYTASGLTPNTAYSWTVVATWDPSGDYCGAIAANGTTTTNPVYTVTYVKAGGETGSVPTDDNTYPQGGSVTVAGKGTLNYSGYDFAGWKCSQDGETYTAEQTVTMGGGNMTFTAVWTPKKDTYFDDIHKTTGYTGDGHIEEGKYTVPTLEDDSGGSNSCETGHSVFVGWVAESSTNSDGTLKPGSTITYGGTENKAADNIKYHAVWAESSK